MTAPDHPAPHPRPTWALIVGAAIGTLTLFFLMAFPLISILTGKRIECGDTFWVILIFALAIGLSSAFLGGYAAASGNIAVPLLGSHPLTVGLTGGIASVAVGAGIAFLVVSHGCVNPEMTRLKFDSWDYKPKEGKLEFRLIEDTVKLRNFLRVPEADQYEAWVAIRSMGSAPPAQGSYPILIGPYPWGPTGDKTEMDPKKIAALGSSCAISFLVFGLKKSDANQSKPSAPFRPADYPNAHLFHMAGITTCK